MGYIYLKISSSNRTFMELKYEKAGRTIYTEEF